MSKEISLSDLLQNTPESSKVVKPSANIVKPGTVEVKKEEPVIEETIVDAEVPAEESVAPAKEYIPGKPAKPVSIDDIAKTLPGKPQEEIKNPKIVDDAFKAMHDTIAEKKRFIEEDMLPIVEQNAKEIAMEEEMKKMGVESKDEDEDLEESLDEEDDSNILDMKDIDEELEKEDVKEEETVVIPTLPKINKTEEPAKEEPKKVYTKAELETNTLEDEEESLDELLKEIDNSSNNSSNNNDDFDEEEDIEETRARLKQNISEIIQPSKIDFSKFTVRSKPLSVNTVLNAINSSRVVKTADWALLGSKRSITISEVDGPELDNLIKSIRNSNSINAAIMSLKLIYNHLIDANKPSFEEWAKTIHTEDLDSLYFALYKATYADTNMIAYRCAKNDDKEYGCKKTSVLNIDIDKMVKFEDSEVEAQFKELLAHDTTTSTTAEDVSLMALSDKIAITYNMPNLYSTLIQYSTLNPKIVDKYDDLLNTLAYIDGFFYIDHENNELVPMPVKQYPNNLNKTVLEKIKLYGQILKTLTPDEYDIALAKLGNLGETSKITYIMPETKCPECGSVIAEEPIANMLDMVFSRRQLAQIQGL